MDPQIWDLDRFLDAQDPIYSEVLEELRRGQKATHWMWFIFPQLRGLGSSSTAERYGLASLAEAKAYREHPVLGPRLIESTRIVHALKGRTAHDVFGSPDDLKFRSCLTLFAQAAPDEPLFQSVLEQYFGGQGDPRTLAMLSDSRHI